MPKMKGREPGKGKRIAPPPPLPSAPNYDLEPPVFCFRYLEPTAWIAAIKMRKRRWYLRCTNSASYLGGSLGSHHVMAWGMK